MSYYEPPSPLTGKAPRHQKSSIKTSLLSTLRKPISLQHSIDDGLYNFMLDYYNKEPLKRIIWKGKDFTEKTAKIEQKKLGIEWSIEKSPYSENRFAVTKIEQKEPFNEYLIKYKNDLKIIYDQQKRKGLVI